MANEDREDIPQFYFLPGLWSQEDEQQEYALHQLLSPGKPFHFRNTAGITYSRQMSYGSAAPEESCQPWEVNRPVTVNEVALDQLIQWMFTQDTQTQSTIERYLDEPSDEIFETVLQDLGIKEPKTLRVKKHTEVGTVGREGTLTAVILRALPATYNEIMTISRNVHPSKRPEAAARQVIRRLIEANIIKKDGDTYYVIAK